MGYYQNTYTIIDSTIRRVPLKNILILITALSLSGFASAEEVVLKAVQGTVTIRPVGSKKWVPAKIGRKIKQNEQVRTDGLSLARLDFASGATLIVKERSWFSIKQDKKGRIVAFRLGEFLIGLRKKVAGQTQLRVRTPAAVAAVRGTVFWGKSDDQKTSEYACFKGSINVWGQGKNVILEPGMATSIKLGQPPVDPTPNNIPDDYVNTFKIEESLGTIEELLQE